MRQQDATPKLFGCVTHGELGLVVDEQSRLLDIIVKMNLVERRTGSATGARAWRLDPLAGQLTRDTLGRP